MIATRRSTLAGAAASAFAGGAQAQAAYPDKPIRMVIASPPAGRPTSSAACWRPG
jgi:tripartite-type tricarboxylate transporter receptor subunit TctC